MFAYTFIDPRIKSKIYGLLSIPPLSNQITKADDMQLYLWECEPNQLSRHGENSSASLLSRLPTHQHLPKTKLRVRFQ